MGDTVVIPIELHPVPKKGTTPPAGSTDLGFAVAIGGGTGDTYLAALWRSLVTRSPSATPRPRAKRPLSGSPTTYYLP